MGSQSVAYGERIQLIAQADKQDDRIVLGLVRKITHFSGVEFSISTSEVEKVPQTLLA